ncbi:MAG: multi-sensor signal transduction histidine kinase [Gemmatimonadetes bacterium]|nr:multi-sensor signal transduction histidine kinase [Gemmatimonadota bacterium]
MSDLFDARDLPARILIVDDDRQNRRLLEVMLTAKNYQLQTAASGEEALALVAKQPPDLILLDVMMPGMDGNEVASTLKLNPATKNIPIIMVTALSNHDARMVALRAGAADFLTKPVDHAELCVRVRNLLRLKAYGDYYDRYSQTLEREVISRTADLRERTALLEHQTAVLTAQAELLDLARDAIVVRDMDGRVISWSRGAEALYGWASAEAIGHDVFALLSTKLFESREAADATLRLEGQWEGEAIHHARDGTRSIVASRWTLQRNADGVPIRVLSIDNDITDRKLADADRHMLTERLSLATAAARVGVWEWDLASNSLMWDATMFDIYGMAPLSPMPYERWSATVAPEDLPTVEAAQRLTIENKGQVSAEYRIILEDGSVRIISYVERVVLDEQGNVTRMIGVNADVTERKAAEEALEQNGKERMRFKDEFLSNVSHELRSPLTAIKQFTSILFSGIAGELSPVQREYQQIVLKNVRQLQSMIDDLLEVTRLESGKLTVELESTSIHDAIGDALDTLQGAARSKGVQISWDVPPDLPAAYADQTRLRQMLIILLDNAIKFTAKGGNAQIRAQLLPSDSRYLLLEVSDDGCGIPADRVEHLFDRLYQASATTTASRKGLGLGLYICRELSALQGGEIRVAQRLPRGSTFSFTIPVFSLSSVIAPLLNDGAWPGDSTSLVTVTLGLSGAAPSSQFHEDWSRDARSLLGRCLRPELDVLLPRTHSAEPGGQFFIATFADDLGTSVLASNIRSEFERFGRLDETGLTLSITHKVLSERKGGRETSADVLISTLVSTLEAAIESQILSGAVQHE